MLMYIPFEGSTAHPDKWTHTRSEVVGMNVVNY